MNPKGKGLWHCSVGQLVQMAALTLAGYAFFIAHGLSPHIDPWSQAFINLAVQHIYPKEGQEDTTVLLFREENIASLDSHYPVPYDVHAQVIEALASYEPRAVFIDFAFVDKRRGEDVGPLTEALCALSREGKTRLFLAAPVDETGRVLIRRELQRCAGLATPEIFPLESSEGLLAYTRGSEFIPQDSGSALENVESAFMPSAAFALAEDIGVPATGEDLEIVWGKGVAPLNREWMDCREPGRWHQIRTLLTEGPLANRLKCPYTRTITVAHLLNSSGDRDIEDSLKGRTVFYGADFNFSGDRIRSPVYAEMPGVYLHAMAYDNLKSFGHNYKRLVPPAGDERYVNIALLLIIALVLVKCERTPAGEAQSATEFIFRLVLSAGGGLIALVVLLLVAGQLGLDSALLLAGALFLLHRGWRDPGFGVAAGIVLIWTVVSYFLFNMGPRNVLAFLLFFLSARSTQEFLQEKWAGYHRLRSLEMGAALSPRTEPASSLTHKKTRETIHE